MSYVGPFFGYIVMVLSGSLLMLVISRIPNGRLASNIYFLCPTKLMLRMYTVHVLDKVQCMFHLHHQYICIQLQLEAMCGQLYPEEFFWWLLLRAPVWLCLRAHHRPSSKIHLPGMRLPWEAMDKLLHLFHHLYYTVGILKRGLSISKAYLSDIVSSQERQSVLGMFNACSRLSLGFILILVHWLVDI